ncbi:hypothetical protein, partial [Neisseria animalis]|uniref:hypothetical protein n=1 Tax=Neisseria animalis TaxID=492 RepID=UPI001B86951A
MSNANKTIYSNFSCYPLKRSFLPTEAVCKPIVDLQTAFSPVIFRVLRSAYLLAGTALRLF